ncbi:MULTISPECIES: hypothetical protein [unclassified Streptomyces]|uniref:hypothetical protein n=1 Tax=unclassified Streptomyces TaxID=2593676 RepID=UPI002E280E58|nr:hypothetical protein [Streptomyces sp. NBC_00273]
MSVLRPGDITDEMIHEVQQHLKDQGVDIIQAILITTRLLGDHPSSLRAAREVVEGSPARTTARPQ